MATFAPAASGTASLRLAPHSSPDSLARIYRETGRVRLAELLVEADAEWLCTALEGRDDWWQLINMADGVTELDRAARARMSARRRAALDSRVFERARTTFQYRYEALKVPVEAADVALPDDPLAAFARLARSREMLDLLGAVIGEADLAFVDGQATAYGVGDFLTAHDDDVSGRNRAAAVVLGLTRRWRYDWGGILLFPKPDGSLAGLVPGFNTLDLFAVPQVHSVSLVSPVAPVRRYAVTGWLQRC